MRGFSFQPTKVKLELCRLCIISPNPLCHLIWPAPKSKNYTLPNGSWKVFSVSNNKLLLRLKSSFLKPFWKKDEPAEVKLSCSDFDQIWEKVHFCRQALVALLCRGFEFPLLEHFHHRFISLIGWDEDNKRCQMCFQLSETNWEKMYIRTCFFCVFKAIKIQNGHFLNVQMKGARNSDSQT